MGCKVQKCGLPNSSPTNLRILDYKRRRPLRDTPSIDVGCPTKRQRTTRRLTPLTSQGWSLKTMPKKAAARMPAHRSPEVCRVGDS